MKIPAVLDSVSEFWLSSNLLDIWLYIYQGLPWMMAARLSLPAVLHQWLLMLKEKHCLHSWWKSLFWGSWNSLQETVDFDDRFSSFVVLRFTNLHTIAQLSFSAVSEFFARDSSFWWEIFFLHFLIIHPSRYVCTTIFPSTHPSEPVRSSLWCWKKSIIFTLNGRV